MKDPRKPLLPIDPAAHAEDWDMLIPEVIEKSYPLADGSGRRMPIKISGSDSAGKDGFTTNAVAFWQRLRDDPRRAPTIIGASICSRVTTRVTGSGFAYSRSMTATPMATWPSCAARSLLEAPPTRTR